MNARRIIALGGAVALIWVLQAGKLVAQESLLTSETRDISGHVGSELVRGASSPAVTPLAGVEMSEVQRSLIPRLGDLLEPKLIAPDVVRSWKAKGWPVTVRFRPVRSLNLQRARGVSIISQD